MEAHIEINRKTAFAFSMDSIINTISGKKSVQQYIDERQQHLPWQQCAFSKESSKYKGCGILKRNFYTRFIPIFKDLGL